MSSLEAGTGDGDDDLDRIAKLAAGQQPAASPSATSPAGGDDLDAIAKLATSASPTPVPIRAAWDPAKPIDFDQSPANHGASGTWGDESPLDKIRAALHGNGALERGMAQADSVKQSILGPDLTAQLHTVASDPTHNPVVRGAAMAAGMATGAVEHPVTTAETLLTAPLNSTDVLTRYAYQRAAEQMGVLDKWSLINPGEPVTGQDATWAAAQLAALGVAGPMEGAIAKRLSVAITERAAAGLPTAGMGLGAAIVSHAAPGALVGAAYTPEDPLAGAVAGGALGGVTAAATGARVAAAPPPPLEGANLAEHPERLLGERVPSASATAKVATPEPVATDAPFSVEMNTPGAALEQTLAQRGTSAGAQLIDEIKNRRAADKAANTDALTGIGNMRAYEIAKARAEADPNTSIIRFDLNGFKAVNDNVGHEAGDTALKDVADAMTKHVPPGRGVFRVGGDEFAAIVPTAQAESVRDAIEQEVGVREIVHPDAMTKAAIGDGPVPPTTKYSISGGIGATNAEADANAIARKAEQKKAQGINGRAVAPADAPAAAPASTGPGVRREPIANIDVEPERFQYKLNTNEQGVTQDLADVKTFNPDLAGVVSVWRDPADGRLKVINGHHRYELAKRSGETHLDVREITAPNAAMARAVGAMINIGEGKGTPIDAAKLFRESNTTPEDLAQRGIALKGPIARDGLALAKLHPTLFSHVVSGKLPVQRAALIGGSGLSPEQQLALHTMLEQREANGKRLSNDAVSELVRFVRGAGEATTTQDSLFGPEAMTHSLAPEKAELSAFVKERLSKDRRVMGFISKGDRAAQIEGAGVGKIKVDKAADLATRAAQSEELYNKLSMMSGPVADALNGAAQHWAHGGNRDAIRTALYDRVIDALGAETRGAATQRGGEGHRRGGSGAAPVVPLAGPDGAGPDGAERSRSADDQQHGHPNDVAEAAPAGDELDRLAQQAAASSDDGDALDQLEQLAKTSEPLSAQRGSESVKRDGQLLMEPRGSYDPDQLDAFKALQQQPAAAAAARKEDAITAFGSETKRAEIVRALERIQRAALPTASTRLAEMRAAAAARKGWTDLRGTRLETPEDVHRALQAYRHPGIERMHVLLLDDDMRVVSHTAETSGAISFVDFHNIDQWIDAVVRRAKRMGVTRVVASHNHPSGDPTASISDIQWTAGVGSALQKHGILLLGHVIIDHHRGSWLTARPGEEHGIGIDELAIDHAPAADWTTAFERHQLPLNAGTIGMLVRDAGSPDALTVFHLDTQHRVVAVAPKPLASAATIARWLGPEQRALGSRYTVLAGPRDMMDAVKRVIEQAHSSAAPRTHLHDVFGFDPDPALPEHRWAHNVLDLVAVEPNGHHAPDVTSYAELGRYHADLRSPVGSERSTRLREGPADDGRGPEDAGDARRVSRSGRVAASDVDLFGAPLEDAAPQGSLFGEKEGTASSRSLQQTERAARSELEQLRATEQGASPVARVKIARRIAELEKLLNRHKAISADELKTRAAAASDDLFGGTTAYGFADPFSAAAYAFYQHVKGRRARALGTSTHPMPEPSGFSQRRAAIRPIELAQKIMGIFNPGTLGPLARGTEGTIRHEAAERFRAIQQATAALRALERHIDTQPRGKQVDLWDAYEKGVTSGDAFVDAMNTRFAQVTAQRTQELVRLDRLRAERAIANYIGRFWESKNSGAGVASFLQSIFAKRPFEGPKSFLKERSHEFFVDGLDAGLVPPTYNYVTSQLAKIAEMERLIGAEHMLQKEKENGRARAVMLGVDPPKDIDGTPWVKIDREGNDPAFAIWAPPEVHHWEAVDAIVYGKLQQILEDLGVEHERSVSIGGARLGYAQGDQRIATKFGGAEGVIMHELGHAIDARFHLRRQIEDGIGRAPRRVQQSGKHAGKSVPDYANEADGAAARRTELREELRQLANLRREVFENGVATVPESDDLEASDRTYLHSWPEKMANMVEAYISARDRFKAVAPGIFDVFDGIVRANPALHALRTIEPSLARETHGTTTRLPGPVLAGAWYAPRTSAAVWANHLSKGLRGNPVYDALTAPGMAATQLILGISGFHGTVIATEGMFSDLVMAADHAIAGNGAAAATALGRIVSSPVSSAVSAIAPKRATRAASLAFATKIMAEYHTPGSHPELATVLQAMIAGGFRGTEKSELWTGERTTALKKAVRQALYGDRALTQAWGASKIPLDAIFAGLELASAPLMSKYVPLMKTAATYHAVAKRLQELPPGISMDDFHSEMWDIVKEMDYRFGQVIYENHFINNVAKHLAQAMFLAPGWTFGTQVLMARGARDVAVLPKRLYDRARGTAAPEQRILGRSGKYWVAAIVGTMLINALLTYWATGERPGAGEDGWKDFFAFRDGTADEDGNANRHTIPGYLMHDVYGWTHHPVDTFLNKLSPFFAFAARVAENRTYNGDMVYDEDKPLAAQLTDVAKEGAKDLGTPLSVQNYLEGQRRDEGGLGEMARNAIGVSPAKREFVRTDAQNYIARIAARGGHPVATPDEAAARDDRRQALMKLRESNPDAVDAITRAVERGELTSPQLSRLMKRAGLIPLAERFKALTLDQALEAFNRGNVREQMVFLDELNKKAERAGNPRSP